MQLGPIAGFQHSPLRHSNSAASAYVRARYRALFRCTLRTILRKRRTLLSFTPKIGSGDASHLSVRYGSMRAVPVSQIVGSVGRSADFDIDFSPLSSVEKTRWERVYRVMMSGLPIPPVSLIKSGDSYFVEDGHHRVSVAKFENIAFIDAEIVEYLTARRGDASWPEQRNPTARNRHPLLEQNPGQTTSDLDVLPSAA